MIGQELKILFKQDKAYLTMDKAMTFTQVNLPEIAKTFKSPAYWKIRVINYRETEKKIFCEILSYQIGETEFEDNQKSLSNVLQDIQIVTFRSIDTSGLLKTLYQTELTLRHSSINSQNHYQPKPITRNINETFSVPFKNVQFKLGGVSFDKKFKGHCKTIKLSISNYDIIEEFDAVKDYFAKVLKTNRIQVSVNIEITDNDITSMEVKSPEIDKIDTQLIENVKLGFTKSITKTKINPEIGKVLFTMDEYFDTFVDENIKPNIFYENENALFEHLLTISDTKHYKHLRFLSCKHSCEIMKLRFIHKPFSFIFLLQGDKNYHIIWETLDTEEATYIWQVQKNINELKLTLQRIESTINLIKAKGKIAYINSADDSFNRIFHDYTELDDGFMKWKGEIENILT